MAPTYGIHPSIGVARLGDAPDSVMHAPETALGLPTETVEGAERPVELFRDAEGRIKREAARFRVFRHDDADGSVAPAEIGVDGLVDIEWTVWPANKKAIWFKFRGANSESAEHIRNDTVLGDERKSLIIDAGPRTVSQAASTARFTAAEAPPAHAASFPPPTLRPFSIDTLGEVRTDATGALRVLAGFGSSGTTDAEPKITNYANNDNWFDDVSDGPVTAVLVFGDGRREPVEAGAWVICAPPAYAPEIGNVVTLYDTMLDVAVRQLDHRPDIFREGVFRSNYLVNFTDDLRPLFQRVETIRGVERGIPQHSHLLDWDALQDPSGASAAYRQRIFEVIRPPTEGSATLSPSGRVMMPRALGDDPYSQSSSTRFLTVTLTQFQLLRLWVDGQFDVGTPPQEGPGPLSRAVLDNCVGGAFFPGIETTWIVRDPRVYAAPFRIKHRTDLEGGLHLDDDLAKGLEPGDLTKRMALPWQADFYECGREDNSDLKDVAWWPAQRPLSALDENFQVVEWTRGFVLNSQTRKPGDLQMVRNWKDLGFVRSRRIGENRVFVETERNGGNIAGEIA